MLIQKTRNFLKKKKITDFMVYGIGQAVNIISPLLITPYLIYICGLENLGIIALGQSFAFILIVLVDYSSYIIGVKDVSINRDNPIALENIFTTIYASKLLLFIVVSILTFFMLFFIPYFNKNVTVLFFSFSIIIGQFINPTWFFQGVENFKWISIINVLSKIIYVLGVFIFIKKQEDYVFANLLLGIGAILANLLGLFYILSKYQFSFKSISLANIKKLLVNDFSFCISQFFFAVRNYSSVMIIGFFAGNYIAGQFKVIDQIINLLRTYLQMFFKFSYSYVCFEIDKNLSKGIQLWKKFNGYNFVLLTFILLLLFVFSEYVLKFFRVDKQIFNLLENYLHIALLIPLLTGITLPLEQLIFSLNKNKQYIALTMASTTINLIVMSLLMRFFGLFQVFFLLIITEGMLISIYFTLLKPYFTKAKMESIINKNTPN